MCGKLPPKNHPQKRITTMTPTSQPPSLDGIIPAPQPAALEIYPPDQIQAVKIALAAIQAKEQYPRFLTWTQENAVKDRPATGFHELDKALNGGLMPGLYVIGAISSLGKTTFALQIIDFIATNRPEKPGKPCLIITLEMSPFELMAKSLSRLTASDPIPANRRSTHAILNGDLIPETLRIAERYSRETAGNLYITGEATTPEAIDAVAQSIKITAGEAPVILIDYLQIMPPIDPHLSDKQNIDQTVSRLKRIAVKLDTPLIVISSLNRGSYSEKITMSSFKESGAIEYSADVLIGLQLAGVGESGFNLEEAKARDPRQIEAVILKNRNGRAGVKIPLTFCPRYNLFEGGIKPEDLPGEIPGVSEVF
jgi:replicative DNA helicase